MSDQLEKYKYPDPVYFRNMNTGIVPLLVYFITMLTLKAKKEFDEGFADFWEQMKIAQMMEEYCKTIAYGRDLGEMRLKTWCSQDHEYKQMVGQFFEIQKSLFSNHKLMCKHLITLFIVVDDFFHGMLKCNYGKMDRKLS